MGIGMGEGVARGVGGGGEGVAARGEEPRAVGCWEARATTAPPPPVLVEESRMEPMPVMTTTGVMPQHTTMRAAVPSDVQIHGFSSGGGCVSVLVTNLD